MTVLDTESKLTRGVASRTLADGALRQVPGGYQTGKFMMDQAPILVNSPALNFGSGTAAAGHFMVPFPARIVSVQLAMTTSHSGTATELDIGIVGTADKFLDGYGVEEAAGLHDLTAELETADVDAGDVIIFTAGSQGTAGAGAVTLVLVPRLD